MNNLLVIGLSQILISLLGFLLKELQSSLQSLILCTSLTTLLSQSLRVLQLVLQLLNLGFQSTVLVLKGGDLMLLLEVLLLEGLDLLLELFDFRGRLIGFDSERVQLLLTVYQYKFNGR